MKKIRASWIVSLILSIVFLIIGASFHSYRSNPSTQEQYNLGVTMGILMISLFAIFFVSFIVLLIVDRHYKETHSPVENEHINDETLMFLKNIILSEMHLTAPITKKDVHHIVTYTKSHYGHNLIGNSKEPLDEFKSLYYLGQDLINNINKENLNYINAFLIKSH